MGFHRFDSGPKKTGWLVNIHPATIFNENDSRLLGYSAVDLYFLDKEGGTFKSSVLYDPYFLLSCSNTNYQNEVEEFLTKKLEGLLKKILKISKEDLKLTNHLIGIQRSYLKISFHNVSDLIEARRIINQILASNKKTNKMKDIYQSIADLDNFNDNDYESFSKNIYNSNSFNKNNSSTGINASQFIDDIREYDVPYHVRVAIDKNIRVGKWYSVDPNGDSENNIILTELDLVVPADPVILAYDIETTKAPLKFPNSSVDQIMMISYMIDGQGYLITNREIISKDIEDFEYTPKPEYQGLFEIYNAPNEFELIKYFFQHIRDVQPTVIATFNGDFFDWPFVEARADYHSISMFDEIGFRKDSEGEYKSTYCAHMDCYKWVKRDSYLPQGSQGLKAVTLAKLGYNPLELDPELMTPYAIEQPQILSEYSVSDAVATYYLYYKYVHPFIFSLATIIPLNPDEVLRKGTGTLCEMLLMVQAYVHGIVFPNKHIDTLEKFYDGHLLESETYVGGHVESLETGVFRADLNYDFKIDTTVIDEFLEMLPGIIKFCVTVENKKSMDDIVNYQEVYTEMKNRLLKFKSKPKLFEKPSIYHVDVASMYPNIMISNRLQPDSIKFEKDCALCEFNTAGKDCDRKLTWSWRGEFYPTKMNEYNMIKRALQNESFQSLQGNQQKEFNNLVYGDQMHYLKKNLNSYSRKVYHRITVTETIKKESIVCQKENPFYINTVRDFRDRRYTYKKKAKEWKQKASKVDHDDHHTLEEVRKMIVTYDSLQLAHKVILNSFYGYVMRKGSRWYSMEMAGITCLTGATIIQMARSVVERFGRPLELDTDGIWCIIPSSFPDDFTIKLKKGKISLSFLCSMLNYLVHQKFTNHQYYELKNKERFEYAVKKENSIFFELDGPYRAMVLPTSKEEGKGIKKRYAVFNFDGSISELKGFELKRRGELQLIKNFQSDIFKVFLEGKTLEECYLSVGGIANRWLDVLETKGKMLEDEDLIELISENRNMSRPLASYKGQKSTSITTATRLGEFLGFETVKDAGLKCSYIISTKPRGSPITERAVPVAIFSADISQKRMFLRKWLADFSLEDFDPRNIIDWSYYRERLASTIQKIITIPAAMQNVINPVPRVLHPDWLQKKIFTSKDAKKQSSLAGFLTKGKVSAIIPEPEDIEDFGKQTGVKKTAKVLSNKRKAKQAENEDMDDDELIGPCPKIDEDYVGWLMFQKKIWIKQNEKLQTQERLFGKATKYVSESVRNMMLKQVELYANETWQILEYKATSIPGNVIAFALINNNIHQVKLQVPKTVYLNIKTNPAPRMDIPKCEIEKVKKELPNGSPNNQLYKAVLPESVFITESSRPGGYFEKNVEEIYESHVNTLERLMIELGTCCQFDSSKIGSLSKGLSEGIHVSDLRLANNSSYLSRSFVNVVYLLHIFSNQYEIFVLFVGFENKAYVLVLKPSHNSQNLTSKIEREYGVLYKENEKKISSFQNIIEYSNDMEFDVSYFSDSKKLDKKVGSLCSKIFDERGRSSIMVFQSPFVSKVLKSIKVLGNFPVIKLASSEVKLSVLQWQTGIVSNFLKSYFSLGTVLSELISFSRYSNIPICNLPLNNIGFLIDIEYSRMLSKGDVVLWWSKNTIPDHGGSEKDQIIPMTETFEFPSMNKGEVYETVSIEVSVSNLIVNTLLSSSLVNEAEGADLANSDVFENNVINDQGTLAEDSFSSKALGILKKIVKRWWEDALLGDRNGDLMIHNFVLWLQTSKSYLYDPVLHYHIENLSKKVFLQLIKKFQEMGTYVFYANRGKLILNTSKLSLASSYAFCQYIIKAIRTNSLFHYLELSIVKYWDLVIWMDQYNYSGKYCEEIDEESDKDIVTMYESNWQLKRFLPLLLQGEFEDWVVVYLELLEAHKKKQCRINSASYIGKWGRKKKGAKGDEEEAEKLFESIRLALQQRIGALRRGQNEAMMNQKTRHEYDFPKFPISSEKQKDPTLMLVKFILAVYALSRKRNMEVSLLRRDLLNIFDVGEFNESAIFKNPGISLKLSSVVCQSCSYVKDIDFCRDTEQRIWICDSCGDKFNSIAIEEQLVALLQKWITTYCNQDLKCERCKKIRSDPLSKYCICSGSWGYTMDRKSVLKQIKLLEAVAIHFDFRILLECFSDL
ncbi:DNA polymerase epsilon catalytic subunit [Ascoidea rubescens DSM 1968]|uniref:DNA polymerase epsilon catalytic subunit n=1 Tax=Ascoidea rubescens DSM 1968 TaxID=1344418 RepID=A0A1D2VS28_9ASCO|nr:DNA polymerase epsilon catalytic subunit A [Ascoidea rubescens DSM 1968]ODV64406.1 DNA polymerase epsilon catalytic subunit A [Ascoidea rubescens DSM 1968]